VCFKHSETINDIVEYVIFLHSIYSVSLEIVSRHT